MKDELDIYTTLEEAKEEIWRRWNDKDLRKKVEDFLNNNIPDPFKNEPRAVLFRQVMTPDIECGHFLKLAEKISLKPLGWEYLSDKFSTRNHDKVGLCKMAFFKGKDKNQQNIIEYKKIIDLTESDNKKFKGILTLAGENFIDFHHRILKLNLLEFEFFDASEWFDNFGGNAEEYYRYFMALFICHGVLLENFVTDESEREFAEKIVYPAIDYVKKEFGVSPIIIPLAPKEEADNDYWWCYPEKVKHDI